MQAVVVNGTGDPDILQLVPDHPLPKRGPKQVCSPSPPTAHRTTHLAALCCTD
jgi:hypothetical protein